jgi:hypothetical protein
MNDEGKPVMAQQKTADETIKQQLVVMNEEKIPKVTTTEAFIANIIIGIIALTIYFPVEITTDFTILNDEYYGHVVISLLAFVAVPVLYFILFRVITGKRTLFFIATRKGLQPKNIISSLIQGITMHAGIFYPWILISQNYAKNIFHLANNLYFLEELPVYLSFVALNVIMFEYYSKSVIQIQFMEAEKAIRLFGGKIRIKGGKWIGFVLQNIAWIGGHIQEYLWLRYYLGPVNAAFFIIVSGVLTGWTVMKTENIFGVVIGHILLNVFITLTYAV